jgi:outer membrane lipoprotein-sorting protein
MLGTLLALTTSFTLAADFLPTSFSADYNEKFTSSATGKEKTSSGHIDFQRPGLVRFAVLKPDPSTFVSNGKTSWYYTPPFIDGEEGQVVVQKSEGMPFTLFLEALSKGTHSNAGYDVKKTGNRFVLTFKGQLRKYLQMKEAILEAEGDASRAMDLGDFKYLLMTYSSGKKVNMQLTNFKRDVKFADDHFVFIVPPKTKISQGK